MLAATEGYYFRLHDEAEPQGMRPHARLTLYVTDLTRQSPEGCISISDTHGTSWRSRAQRDASPGSMPGESSYSPSDTEPEGVRPREL